MIERGGNQATEAPRGDTMFAYVYDDKNGSDVFDASGMTTAEAIDYALSKFLNLTSIEVEVGDIEDIDEDNPETRVIWSR